MMKKQRQRWIRWISLLSAVALAMTMAPAALATMPMPAATTPMTEVPFDWDQLQIELSWIDAEGMPQSMIAAPVYDAAGSFWIMVPPEAMNTLTVTISDPNHAYLFWPENGTRLLDAFPEMTDAGENLDFLSFVPITAREGEEMKTFSL